MAALTRRDWLRLLGEGTAALTIGCNVQSARTTRDAAVAILEPATDALTVAIWARSGAEAVVEIRADRDVRRMVVSMPASRSAALDVEGLAADTEHEITVVVGGAQLGPYRARTAPRDDDPRAVRIAVAADADTHPSFDTDLIDHLLAAAPDLLVTLGDFPYTDNGPPAVTLPEYRARHVRSRTLAKYRALHEAVGVRAIYDDHELCNDWDAERAAADPERCAAAMTAWDEFFPVRGATGEIRYRSWRWGAHAECFLLDCRRFRSANQADDGPGKTMLGARQLAWLLDAIARSAATFKLVFTTVPLDFGNGDDHWRSFAHERQRIFDALVGLPGVVFFSGDQHWFAAHRHAHGIREFQIGPLARGICDPGPPAPGVLFRATQYNAGLLEIDGAALRFTAIGPGGERLYEETLTADQLTPRYGALY